MSDLTALNSQIWNCEHAFSTLCPKQWSELALTEQPGIRHCSVCNQDVTYCETPEEFVSLGNAGKCIAVPDQHHPLILSRMLLGRPSVDAIRSLDLRQRETAAWWNEAIKSLPAFANGEFDEVSRLAKAHGGDSKSVPVDQLTELIHLVEAVQQGPESLHVFLRSRLKGTPEDRQNILIAMGSHFDLSARECDEIAARMDAEHPEKHVDEDRG
ncbi:MAG: hypothetical protein U0996_14410 [Planctomycetaceae bacterium]